jgi:DsbC/DsbD-like thiol-disulfide interchange protein
MSLRRSTPLRVAVAVSAVLVLHGGPHLAARQSSSELDLGRGLKQSGNRVETRHLTLTTSTSAVTAQGGVTLFVDVSPKPKMHVYSPEQKDVITVALTVGADGIRVGPTKYPKPEKYFFAPLKETQYVYSRPFRLAQDATLTTTPGTELTIKGTLRYQACDDAVCYVPQNVPVTWMVKR